MIYTFNFMEAACVWFLTRMYNKRVMYEFNTFLAQTRLDTIQHELPGLLKSRERDVFTLPHLLPL